MSLEQDIKSFETWVRLEKAKDIAAETKLFLKAAVLASEENKRRKVTAISARV